MSSAAFVPLRSTVELPATNPYIADLEKQDSKHKALKEVGEEDDDDDDFDIDDVPPTNDRSKEVQAGADDQRKHDQRRLKKYAKKGLILGIASTIGHLAPGSSGALSLFALFSTHRHIQRLRVIRQKECVKGGQCHSALDFIIAQKIRKRTDAGVKTLPLVGQAASLKGKLKNLYKRWKKTAGAAREANAKLLVDHAREGCTVAGAAFVEIVIGDYRSQDNWDKGLKLIPSAYALDAAKDKMSATA